MTLRFRQELKQCIDEITQLTNQVKQLELRLREKEVEVRLSDLKIKELKKTVTQKTPLSVRNPRPITLEPIAKTQHTRRLSVPEPPQQRSIRKRELSIQVDTRRESSPQQPPTDILTPIKVQEKAQPWTEKRSSFPETAHTNQLLPTAVVEEESPE